jgi:hypothetical protein
MAQFTTLMLNSLNIININFIFLSLSLSFHQTESQKSGSIFSCVL